MKNKTIIVVFCLAILLSPKIYAATNSEDEVFKTVIDLFKSILDSSKTEPIVEKNPITNPNITDINQLLSGDNISAEAAQFMGDIAGCIQDQNRQIYETAANSTGLPWQVIAGLHFREGGCNVNSSLVSGRAIGEMEPDIDADCSSDDPNSLLIPINGGCGFRNVTDSAIYAANHLIGKIGKVPSNFEELVEATAGYNGWGNANCRGSVSLTGYDYCPPSSSGDDHPYAMNMFDAKHSKMYVRYVEDGVLSSNPNTDGRPGVMTAIQLISFATK